MKIVFMGTRGYIEAKTARHRRHTSTLVEYYGKKILIDFGEDWQGMLSEVGADAILITHAHPDHSFGLVEGADCPVYATEESWESMQDYPIEERKVVVPREAFQIGRITCEAFEVVHSLRAPAVGYRITAGKVTTFYVPDVVYIPQREAALGGVRIYIGDGASLKRSLVRRNKDQLFGHTPVRTQLTWCQKEGVPEAIITHLGTGIVSGDERKIEADLREMAEERGIAARLAYDGMQIVLR